MMYFKIILIALIVFACLIIACPETRLGLKGLIKKYPFFSGSLICFFLIIIIFLYFPLFFKLVATDFWGISLTVYKDGTVEVVELTDLGSIGDIFGSLNSFISSIALCAVAFSTWLQITSLRETREANQKQLIEAKNAAFSDMFYNLLTHSKDTVNALTIKGESKTEILNGLSDQFSKLLKNDWRNNLENLTHENVRKALKSYVDKISDGQRSTGLYSSFYNYKTLISFVKNGKNKDEWGFYMKIISNSMPYTEKKTLLWLAINSRNDEYLECLKGTHILDLKLEPLSRETSEEKEERELMLMFIRHFQIDPTSFKYHPDLKTIN